MSKSPAVAEVVDVITKTPNESNGRSALFWRLNEEWGVKSYFHKDQRDRGYKMQMLASNAGLAPRVGYRFQINIPSATNPAKTLTYFCYTTESAAMVVKDSYYDSPKEESYLYPDDERYPLKDIRQVYLDLLDVGFEENDAHWGNYGWMRDGTPVCIDFGDMAYHRPSC